MVAVTRLGPGGSPRASFGEVRADLSGTVVPSTVEASIVAGSETLIITLNGDTWLAASTGPIGTTANSQAILDGITSGQSEPAGWNAEVRDKEVVGAIARTSDVVATITFSASASYAITGTETITVTVPTEALVKGAAPLVATSTFQVFPDVLGLDNLIPQVIPFNIPDDIPEEI
jgi:hypothetical protein